jgi:hypothetical protein
MQPIVIYTHKNWLLIKYLWPKGDYRRELYSVWLDVGSVDYNTSITKLAKHCPYLAEQIKAQEADGYVSFKPIKGQSGTYIRTVNTHQ